MSSWLTAVMDHPDPRSLDSVAAPTSTATVVTVEPAPFARESLLECLDKPVSSHVDLTDIVALDRLASGYGTMTFDLDGASPATLFKFGACEVNSRCAELDLHEPFEKVVIALLTPEGRPTQVSRGRLRISALGVTLDLAIPGGTGYGVWPLVSLYSVGQHVVVVPEFDERSGPADAVADAYGFLAD